MFYMKKVVLVTGGVIIIILGIFTWFIISRSSKTTPPLADSTKIFESQASLCSFECTGASDEKASYTFNYPANLIVSDTSKGVIVGDASGTVANIYFVPTGEKPYSIDDYIKERASVLCPDCKDVVNTSINKNISRIYTGSQFEYIFMNTSKPAFVVFEIVHKPFDVVEKIASSFMITDKAVSSASSVPPFKVGDKFGDFTAAIVNYTPNQLGAYTVQFVGTTTVSGRFAYDDDVGTSFVVDSASVWRIPSDPNYSSNLSFCFTGQPDLYSELNVDASESYTITISDFFLSHTFTGGCNDAKFVKIVQ